MKAEEKILEILEILISDKFWFNFIQLGIILIFLFALYKDLNRNRGFIIGRGEESRKLFMTSAGVIITVLISVIFQISNYPKDGRVLLYLVDIIIIIYFCFYSSWFTNKLVALKNSFEKRKF